LLSSMLHPQICDLGSARTLQHTTKQTTVVGTYAYIAPEVRQWRSTTQRASIQSGTEVYFGYSYKHSLSYTNKQLRDIAINAFRLRLRAQVYE